MNDYHWGEDDHLSRIWIRGFKSLAEVSLELAPLTVLVGPNSVGKSSVLQAALALVQAATSHERPGVFPLNGNLVRLGRYSDLLNNSMPKGAPIELGFELVPGDGNPARKGSDQERLLKLRRILESEGRSDEVLSTGGAHVFLVGRDAGRASIRRVRLHSTWSTGLQSSLDVDRQSDTASWTTGSGELAQHFESRVVRWAGFLPSEARVRLTDPGRVVESISERVRKGLETTSADIGIVGRMPLNPPDRPQLASKGPPQDPAPTPEEIRRSVDWALSYAGLGPTWIPDSQPPPLRDWPTAARHEWYAYLRARLESTDWHIDETHWFEEASTMHGFWADRVKYLGPLREEPRISYEYGSALPGIPIGPRGESWPDALMADTARRWRPLPPGSPRRKTNAIEAVNEWIAWFELGAPLKIRQTKAGVEPKTGVRDFTSVGTGLSQAIPVMAICLLADPGDLILLEQPEVHLHPRVQQRLGDFLLSVARSGRRLIVETHSEYLITRLRRRAVEQSDARHVFTIYFAESASDGRSILTKVNVDELGGVQEWPPGFFDESADEMRGFLDAVVRKRRGAMQQD